jgi:hypothetical protein
MAMAGCAGFVLLARAKAPPNEKVTENGTALLSLSLPAKREGEKWKSAV